MKIADDLRTESATAHALGSGAVLAGQFELEELLGRGGMGEVWRARDRVLDRQVAIKVLPATLASSKRAFEALRKEAAQAIELAHEALVRVHHFGLHEEQPFLVMEYVRGRPLARVLDEEGPMDPARALAILVPLAAGLCYAHARKLVHRDVKPANVLLREQGEAPALVDFGIAAEVRDQATRHGLTGEAPAVGTLSYMSPEQVKGKRPAPAMDVYGLAVTAYEMLGGHPPFWRGDPLAVQHQILNEPPEPIEGLAAPVNEALARGLAKDPAQRWPTPAAMVAALGEALGAARAPGLPPPAKPDPRLQETRGADAPFPAPPSDAPGTGETAVHSRLNLPGAEPPPLSSGSKPLRPASSPGTRLKLPPRVELPVPVHPSPHPAAPDGGSDPVSSAGAGPPGLRETLAPLVSGGAATVFGGVPTVFLGTLWMWTLKEYGITGTRRSPEGYVLGPADLVLHAAYYLAPFYVLLGPVVGAVTRFVGSLARELGLALGDRYARQCGAFTFLGALLVLGAPSYGGLDRGETAGIVGGALLLLAAQLPAPASFTDPFRRRLVEVASLAAGRAAFEPLVFAYALYPLLEFALGELIHTGDPVQQFFLALGVAIAALPGSLALALLARLRRAPEDWVAVRGGLTATLLVPLTVVLLGTGGKPETLLFAPLAFLVAAPIHLGAMRIFLPPVGPPATEALPA